MSTTTAPTIFARMPSPLDELLLTGSEDALTGVYFTGHRRGPDPDATWAEDTSALAAAIEQLTAYLAGQRDDFDLPIAPAGTDAQLAVWAALRRIPRGRTTTYGALAADLGRPGAARAVAGAVARNPLSIVVPCHRVVGADGSLTGYAGGVERKRWLLSLEGAAPPLA